MDGMFGEPSATRRSAAFKRYQTDLSASFSTDVDLPGVGIAYRNDIKPLEEPEKTWNVYVKDTQYNAWDTYKKHLDEYDSGSRMRRLQADWDWSRDIPILTEDPELKKLAMMENALLL